MTWLIGFLRRKQTKRIITVDSQFMNTDEGEEESVQQFHKTRPRVDSVSSTASTRSNFTLNTEHLRVLRQYYSTTNQTRNNQAMIEMEKSLISEIQTLKDEKELILATLDNLKTKLDVVEKQKKVIAKREIFWQITYIDEKIKYVSDTFCFADSSCKLIFSKTLNDDTFGFFLECHTDTDIVLDAKFRLHHDFHFPLCVIKKNQVFAGHSKKGILEFISSNNLLYYITDHNKINLSVVLELS